MASCDISPIEKILWKFPIEARIHTRKAASLGMAVSLENTEDGEFICWQGSNDLFAKSEVAKAGIDFAKIKWGKWFCPWGLRGNLSRHSNGDLKFVIYWVYLPSRRVCYMRNVRVDDAFNRFKERCLAPIENLQTKEDSE